MNRYPILKPIIMKNFIALSVGLMATMFAGCSDDPESTNEEEVITTIVVTLTPATGPAITLSWDDTNLDAIVDDTEITVSGGLKINTSYTAGIQLLNKSAEPDVDITEEVEEESKDHLFCFTVTGAALTIGYDDEDRNGLPIGLSSTWTTTTASTGTVNITLRHQPGVKTGDCPGAGDTDASITFNIEVLNPG
jgi:hypothetical protein